MENKVVVLRKKGVRRWRLSVDQNGAVAFSAPIAMPQKMIDEAIEKHSAWIARTAARRVEAVEKAKKIYADRGGLIPLLGEWIAYSGDLKDFYRKEARKFFAGECERIASAIGVSFDKIRIGDQKSRYGSCSVKKTLSFSFRVAKAPLFVAKYIAAHEVAHLKYMHHRKPFWDCVESIAPDYIAAEKWLKDNRDFLRLDPCSSCI